MLFDLLRITEFISIAKRLSGSDQCHSKTDNQVTNSYGENVLH